jgi:hypothetical protein
MSSRRRYEWRYLFSFVRPQTGETINIIGSTVSAAIMSAVLQEFADDAGLGAKRRAVLVLDGAGWHVAKDLRVPEGIHLVFLPPYSPELQPAERLWPIVNEAVANRGFHTIGDLEKAVEHRCLYMDAHKAYVKSLTCYHWSPIPKISGRPMRNFCAPRRLALARPAASWRACSAHPTP